MTDLTREQIEALAEALRSARREGAEAMRERAAVRCEAVYADPGFHPFMRQTASNCAAAIRALSPETD